MARVSVCITTYNRAPLLDRTLASLAAQTRRPDELIVSDDCSPDETRAVAEKWAHHFTGFRYNRNSRNLYMPGNLNAAVSLATGDYIANLHDADEFDPTLLEKWERALDDFPSAGFVFSGVGGVIRGGGEYVFLHDVAPFTPGRRFFEEHYLHKFSSIVWGTVMARRSAYEKLLPFDPGFGFISDVDMWMRMCLDHDVAYVREPLIVLDDTPTQERLFSWNRVETARRIQQANIGRFFSAQPERLRIEQERFSRISRQYYLRRILGRIRHAEWKGAGEGVRLFLKISENGQAERNLG